MVKQCLLHLQCEESSYLLPRLPVLLLKMNAPTVKMIFTNIPLDLGLSFNGLPPSWWPHLHYRAPWKNSDTLRSWVKGLLIAIQQLYEWGLDAETYVDQSADDGDGAPAEEEREEKDNVPPAATSPASPSSPQTFIWKLPGRKSPQSRPATPVPHPAMPLQTRPKRLRKSTNVYPPCEYKSNYFYIIIIIIIISLKFTLPLRLEGRQKN